MARVRTLLYGMAALGAACVWPGPSRSALSSIAATLVEATPFLIAGALACRVLPRSTAWVPYFGCGCGAAAARSLPAAALTALAFGPLVAIARLAAAAAIGRLRLHDKAHAHPPNVLHELHALLPGAIAAAVLGEVAGRVEVAHLAMPLQVGAGVVMGFFAPPCAVGSAAFAAALHARAPAAAASFLCVAGIADVRTVFAAQAHERNECDAFAYAAAALACAVVAFGSGDRLVRPAFAFPLTGCAIAFGAYAVRHRPSQAVRSRVAPVLMLAGSLGSPPAPAYYATETTLAQLFPGERLTFTGVLAVRDGQQSVVRYAMTCCRADAAPVSVRLALNVALAPDSWVRVDGTIVAINGDLRLLSQRATAIPPPSDPFIYR